MKKRYLAAAVLAIILQLVVSGTVSYAQTTRQIKEINLVYLHGAGSTSASMQLLSDTVEEKLPAYIADYQAKNPNVLIQVDSLNRNYPNNVDINTWANNIANGIKNHFKQNNLILIGHSMGGKTALYMAAHNTGNLTNSIGAVITIDSPIKNLSRYYFTGGVNFWAGAFLVRQDAGVINSLAYYDSSTDGQWVGTNKHWMALVAGENAPLSHQFDTNGVDPLPRDMDDKIVPISAQYASGADVVYYGQHDHGEFNTNKEVAGIIADDILKYIFGDTLDFSVLSQSGSFGHKAGNFPTLYKWNEITGEVPSTSGSFTFKNNSWGWQTKDYIVGGVNASGKRSSYAVVANSLPFVSGLKAVRWLNGDEGDPRLLVRVRAAPFTSVRIDWSINSYIPSNTERDRYEVEIPTGTPFTAVTDATWVSSGPDDFRLYIKSQAEGPQRWFNVNWRTYSKQAGSRKIVDGMPFLFVSITGQ